MFELLPESFENVIGYKVVDTLSIEDETTMASLVGSAIEEFGKVKLLLDLSDCKGPGMAAAWEGMKWVATHYKSIDKVAVVGDSSFLEKVVKFDAKLAEHLGVSEKYFPEENIDKAWVWIKSAE